MQLINLQIETLKADILNLINNSNLPIAVVYYIFKDIQQDLENAYTNVLQQENQAALNPPPQEEEELEQVSSEVVESE